MRNSIFPSFHPTFFVRTKETGAGKKPVPVSFISLEKRLAEYLPVNGGITRKGAVEEKSLAI